MRDRKWEAEAIQRFRTAVVLGVAGVICATRGDTMRAADEEPRPHRSKGCGLPDARPGASRTAGRATLLQLTLRARRGKGNWNSSQPVPGHRADGLTAAEIDSSRPRCVHMEARRGRLRFRRPLRKAPEPATFPSSPTPRTWPTCDGEDTAASTPRRPRTSRCSTSAGLHRRARDTRLQGRCPGQVVACGSTARARVTSGVSRAWATATCPVDQLTALRITARRSISFETDRRLGFTRLATTS